MHDPRAFWEAKASAREEVEAEVEEADEPLEIVEPSRPATVADLNPSTTQNMAWLALCGFWSASQVTRVFLAGKAFKTGERAGEYRPDKTLTNLFTHAAHEDGRAVKVWYQEGKLLSASMRDPYTGAWSVTSLVGELRDYIEGA